MDLFDLYATLTLDADDYEDEMEKAKEQTEETGDSAEDAANGGFTVMKQVLANLATTVITELVSKLKELATSVYEIGTETETSFAQLETIAGAENIDALTESLSDLSVQTGISSSDLALTAYNAISAGSSAEEAAGMVETAAKLATAGFTDTDSALSVLSTTINAYGMEAEDAASISDSLIQVQNLGVTTVAELSSAMGKAISTASAYSIDLYNLEAAYISTTKAGISTEESTTYLSSMFNELGDSGSDVAAILSEETGQTFGQLMDSGYNLADVLNILYESVDGDSEALMNLWGSAEAGKAASAIISQGLDTFAESLDAVSNAAGSTEEAYETMTDTLEWKVSQLKTVGEQMMLQLYEGAESQLGDVVTWASDAGIEILDAFEEGGTTGALETAASIVSETVSDLATSFADNLPTILEQGYEILTNLAEGMIEGIPDLVTTVAEIVTTFVEYVTEYLPDIIGLGVDIITNLIVGLSEAIPDLIAELPAIITAIIETITENLPKLVSSGGEILGNLIEGIIAAIPDLVAELPQIITAIVTGLGALLASIVSVGADIVQGLVDGIIGAISKVTDAATEIGSNILSTIKSFFGISSPSTVMKEQGEYLTEGLAEGMESLPDEAEEPLEEMLDNVKSWGENLSDKALTAGTDMIENLMLYVDTLPGEVAEPLTSALTTAEDFAVNLVEYMQQGASDMIDGFMDFIDLLPDEIAEPLADALANALSFATDFVSDMSTAASDALTDFMAYINQLPGEIMDQLTSIATYVANWGTSLVSSFTSIGKNVMQGLIDGIASMVSSLYDSIVSALSGLVDTAKSALGISSPSKVFAEDVGQWIPEGIAEGIESGASEVNAALEELTGGMVGLTRDGLSGLETEMTTDASSGLGTTTNYGGFEINVYGAEGQDINELADIISERINAAVNRKGAVFA